MPPSGGPSPATTLPEMTSVRGGASAGPVSGAEGAGVVCDFGARLSVQVRASEAAVLSARVSLRREALAVAPGASDTAERVARTAAAQLLEPCTVGSCRTASSLAAARRRRRTVL